MSPPSEAPTPEPSVEAGLAPRQALTISLLFIGYAGCYLCRSHLSVTMPLIIKELAQHGMTADQAKIHLGQIVSLGVLAYAAGKFLLAGSADFWGGRRNFVGSMGGAVLFTVLFAMSGSLPLFTMAWLGNRLAQSVAWAGLVKVASRWFSYSSYGLVLAILSLSFLFGDAGARAFMGYLIRRGMGWREVFYVAASVLFVIFLLNLFFLRESRRQLGFGEPEPNPINLYKQASRHGTVAPERPPNVREWLLPFLKSPAFLLVCGLSLGCTLVREAFNTWTPTYFHQGAGFGEGRAAELSALFPFFGGISALLCGFLSDRLGAAGRSIVTCAGLAIATLALIGLSARGVATPSVAVVLVSIVAFGLLGPYSYLAGAFALDFGGKQGGAVSSGIIDSVGYLGAILAGDTVARISVSFGWPAAFLSLGVVTALSAVASAILYRSQMSLYKKDLTMSVRANEQ